MTPPAVYHGPDLGAVLFVVPIEVLCFVFHHLDVTCSMTWNETSYKIIQVYYKYMKWPLPSVFPMFVSHISYRISHIPMVFVAQEQAIAIQVISHGNEIKRILVAFWDGLSPGAMVKAWLAGNPKLNRGFIRRITDFYGPFSSTPCLSTRG